MLSTRKYIAPRVLVTELRGRYTSKPFSKSEFQAVLFALKNSGIKDAANRIMDDSARFALDELNDLGI
jgi:hypothetical protein